MLSSNAGLMLLELLGYLLALLWALAFPHHTLRFADALHDLWNRLGRREAAAILFIIGLVLIIRSSLIPWIPPPVPGVHDEFSYLLAGDTFASGRLTNPAAPVWKSIETFYVIQQPTYASMYPPAQGLVLAIGFVAGHPWIGVLLSAAIMCGSICWMLQGWVPPAWAFVGSLIAVARLGIYSYWVESYWGGAVAAIGGALVVGSVPRLFRKNGIAPAVVLSVGMLILASSRPFEGLVFTSCVLCIVLFRLSKNRKSQVAYVLIRAAIPAVVVLGLGGAAMGYYFWRVTGNPFRMPYQVHSAQYEVTEPFLWQPLRKAPPYRYRVMEAYHVERQTAAYLQAHSLRGWFFEAWRKAESLVIFYFWPAVIPVALAIPGLRANLKVRYVLFANIVMFVALTLEIWPMTLHYHAPLAGLTVLLLVQVMRYWRLVTWRGKPIGAAISATIPLFCVAMLTVRLSAAALHINVPEHGLAPWFTISPGNLGRARIQRYLEAQPGFQLVLVRYDHTHHVDEEWVHNSADIERSKVVWARDGSDEVNAELLTYFPQRQAWLLEPDKTPPRLTALARTVSQNHVAH